MQSENIQSRQRWLFIAALPILAMAVYAVATWLLNLNRYDAAYFSPETIALYDKPGKVIVALEEAIETQDTATLAVLQGLTAPQDLVLSDDQKFRMALETEGKYFRFLFSDERDHRRSLQFVTEVDGRYVVAPQDAYFYMRSGRWQAFFWPIAGVWWLIEGIAFAMSRVNRNAKQRQAMLHG